MLVWIYLLHKLNSIDSLGWPCSHSKPSASASKCTDCWYAKPTSAASEFLEQLVPDHAQISCGVPRLKTEFLLRLNKLAFWWLHPDKMYFRIQAPSSILSFIHEWSIKQSHDRFSRLKFGLNPRSSSSGSSSQLPFKELSSKSISSGLSYPRRDCYIKRTFLKNNSKVVTFS